MEIINIANIANITSITNMANLSIGNNSATNPNIIAEIDKHIEIRWLKEGRHSKTYIYGLPDYIGDEKKLKKFIENLKKRVGTNALEKEEKGKKYYGFGGDHVTKIKTIMLDELKVPKEKIKT